MRPRAIRIEAIEMKILIDRIQGQTQDMWRICTIRAIYPYKPVLSQKAVKVRNGF